MTTRVSKEPERPRRFHRQSGWGDRNRQLPGPRWDAHDRGEQTTGDTVVSAREEFRTGRDGRRGVGASHSIDEAGEPPEGPRGEKGTPCHDTVGGKHGGCIETLNRANKTTTDRGTRRAKSRDGIHISGLLHRHQLVVPGIPSDPQGRRLRRGRTDGRGLRSESGGQPPVAAGPSQVRHVLCAPGATSLHPQGRLAWRDPQGLRITIGYSGNLGGLYVFVL